MAGHKIAHAALKGPSVIKEIGLGIAFGLVAGGLWKTKAFYDLLEKCEIRIVTGEQSFLCPHIVLWMLLWIVFWVMFYSLSHL